MNGKKIHQKLRKHAPNAVKKAKKLFAFKYPKLFLFAVFIVAAYYIFKNPVISDLVQGLDNFSYFGIFVAGILFSFGFSAPFSVGFFLLAAPHNIFLATIIGGIGSVVGDFFIFKMIKISFMNEFDNLRKIGLAKEIRKLLTRHILMKHYLIYVFAGILIATPLPDEIGVSMLAGLTTIKLRTLMILSFVLHAIAIWFILYLGWIF